MMEMINRDEVLKKIMRYCSYQERCHQEVRKKLSDVGVFGDLRESIIAELIQDNYLNEERFAITFAGGKFRQKAWGKNKIRFELQQRDVSDYCVEKAVNEIDSNDYEQKLSNLVREHLENHKEMDLLLAKDKVLKYCTGRGFEIDLVLRELRKFN